MNELHFQSLQTIKIEHFIHFKLQHYFHYTYFRHLEDFFSKYEL